ncbi:MAG: caspase family protein [Bacteroidota bacterium]
MRLPAHFHKTIALFLVLVFLLASCRTVVETEKYDPVVDEESKELVDKEYKAKLDQKPSVDNPQARFEMVSENKYRYESTVKKYVKYRHRKGSKFGMHFTALLGDAVFVGSIISPHVESIEERILGGLVGLGWGVLFHWAASKIDKYKFSEKIKKKEGPFRYKTQYIQLENKPIKVLANHTKNHYKTNRDGELNLDINDFNFPSFLTEPKDYQFSFKYDNKTFANKITLNSASWMKPYGVISKDEAPLKEEASSFSSTLASLPGGYNSPVLQQKDQWNALRYQDDRGWVESDHLNIFYYSDDVDLLNCRTGQLSQYTKYFKPKSEFEYQEEYEERLEKGRKLQASVIEECLAEAKSGKKQKIKDSYERITLSIDKLGTYNISDTTYPVTINGKTYEVDMDRESARLLKENIDNARVKADKQLNEDGEEYEIFNMEIRHPSTGETYALGEQREPLYVDDEFSDEPELSGIPDLEVVNCEFSEPSGNNRLDALERGRLTLTIANEGNGMAKDLRASLSADIEKGLEFDSNQYLAGIAPGEEEEITFTIHSDKALEEGSVDFSFAFEEENGFPPEGFDYPVQTTGYKAPELAVFETTIDEASNANNNGKIERGELIETEVKIINKGQGEARDAEASIEVNDANIKVVNSELDHALGDMEPGEIKSIRFSFAVNKKYEGTASLPVEVTLGSEGDEEYSGDYPLELALHEGAPSQPPEFIPDVDQNIPETGKVNEDAVAVIIGNENYKETKDVEFATHDADIMKEYLMKVLGYKEENIFVEKDASKGVFQTYFGDKDDYRGKLYNQIKPGKSEVFVYYSGHGAPGQEDQKGYFVPVESDPQYVSQGGYQRDVLYDNLAQLPAKQTTVVVDACFSGKEILDDARAIMPEISEPAFTLENGILLTSSEGDQLSRPYSEKQHGLFTYYFLKALKEKETADKNGDGKLTYNEIYRYVSDNSEGVPFLSRKKFGSEQMPDIMGDGKDEVFLEY